MTKAPAPHGPGRGLRLIGAEEPLVEVRGVRKRFGRRTVLDNVDATVERGEVTAIIGPNAAGKSTLIKAILGLITPDRGTIRVAGRPVSAAGDYRRVIGYMPQAASFPENLTGRDVLELLERLRGPDTPLDRELVAAFGLEAALDQRVRTLSGGTRQKLNAAIAFLFRPALLILDEPTAGLDPVASAILKEKILVVREQGASVVLTSHVLSELEELADTALFLLDGTVRFHGSRGQLHDRTGHASLERAIASLMRGASA